MPKIRMHRCLFAAAIYSGVCAFCVQAEAMSLMDAYALALGHDPTFLAAVKARDAEAHIVPIARAGLLPSIHYAQTYAPSNDQTITSTRTGFFGSTTRVSENRSYSSYAAAVTLRQPLVDYEHWEKYRQSTVQVRSEDARLRARTQELAYRLLTGYIGVLYASDQLELANEQTISYSKQLTVNKLTYSAGESTVTDIIETRAQLDLSVVSALDAKDQLDNAQTLYESIVGAPIEFVRPSPLKEPFEVKPLHPPSLTEWKSIASARNHDLAADRLNLASTQSQIQIEKSRHYPRLELYASHVQNRSDTIATYEQRYRTNTIGIQLTIPIFNGGGVSASVERALNNYESARHTVQAKSTDILNKTEQEYNFVIRGQARIQAHEAAVKAARTRIVATQNSIAGGERRNLDLLDAERQYFTARRNLARTKYEYLLSLSKLHYLSGTLDDQIMLDLSRLFTLKSD